MDATGTRIMVDVAAAGGLAALSAVVKGNVPDPRIFVGTAVVGTVLLMASGPAPQVAVRFAALILVTSALVNLGTVAVSFNRYLNQKGTPS